jgi:hypothetical protein
MEPRLLPPRGATVAASPETNVPRHRTRERPVEAQDEPVRRGRRRREPGEVDAVDLVDAGSRIRLAPVERAASARTRPSSGAPWSVMYRHIPRAVEPLGSKSPDARVGHHQVPVRAVARRSQLLERSQPSRRLAGTNSASSGRRRCEARTAVRSAFPSRPAAILARAQGRRCPASNTSTASSPARRSPVRGPERRRTSDENCSPVEQAATAARRPAAARQVSAVAKREPCPELSDPA